MGGTETGPAVREARNKRERDIMHKLMRGRPGCAATAAARGVVRRLLWLLCGGLVLACAGALAQPQTAASATALDLPLKNEAEYTAQLNAELKAAHEARERHRVRMRWVAAATLSCLAIGLAALVVWALRSRQPRAVRLSRLVLWVPCLLLASAWFFPWSLYAAGVFAPAFPVVWWKRALPWWELGLASVLYLPALLLTWFVFKTMAAMGAG